MIRAVLGRFFRHCIEQARAQEFRVKVEEIDLTRMSDRQISDLVHGRSFNPGVPAAQAALTEARQQLGRCGS